jgi:MYXO-CTERM domain-containing protein
VETTDATTPPVLRAGCNERASVIVWSGNVDPVMTDRPPLSMLHLRRGSLTPTAPGPRVLEPVEGDEWAGIGSDGTDFLVSWRNFDANSRRQVVGQRIAADGRLLDATPFHIGHSNAGMRVTAVWDGAEYLVFSVNTAGGKPFELRGRRVGRNGEPLDGDWTPVASLAQPWAGTGNGSDGVRVAPGRTFLVYDRYFDEDAAGNVRVRGRFVTSAPDPIDAGASDAAPAPASGDAAAPGVAGGGDTEAAGAARTGCSCALGERGERGRPALLLLGLAGLLCRRRRRRRGEERGGVAGQAGER